MNNTIILLFIFAAGIVVTARISIFFTRLAKKVAFKFDFVDRPNQRSSHSKPVPRVGGMAIVVSFFIGILLFNFAPSLIPGISAYVQMPDALILAGALIIALTGFIDDIRGLRPWQKLAAQFAIAVIVLLSGRTLNMFPSMESVLWVKILMIAITFVWIVGIINAVNLIDGLDGLAAGVSVIIISSMTIAIALAGRGPDVVFSAVLIGSLAGFLIYNYHPATVFMGDTGSLFLGYMLAVYPLPTQGETTGVMTLLVPVLALGLPILDTSTAFIRRILQKRSPLSADKEHIHHRVAKQGTINGKEYRENIIVMYILCLGFGLAAIIAPAWGTAGAVASVFLTLSIAGFVLVRLKYLKVHNHLERLLNNRLQP